MDNLLYRRQYIFTNTEIAGFEYFNKSIRIHHGSNWYLYNHPDLPVTIEINDQRELILLGYMLDPYKPTYNNQLILNELILKNSFNELVDVIKGYNGRFVLLCFDTTGIHVVNDAVGFREVYYLKQGNLFACGSTPNLLGQAFHQPFTEDKSKLEFFNSPEFKKADHTWIGFQTLYDTIQQLPPNHALELPSGQVNRFWPSEPFKRLPVDQVAEKCAKLIRGTIESALNRYKIHIGITAGWDTRLLLTASRDFKDRIYFYLNKPESFAENNKDLRIARKLSASLKFKLNIVDIPEKTDEEFRKVFYTNNILAHDKLISVFNEVYRRGWQDTHTLSGVMGNGLARIYMHFPEGIPVTGKNIAVFSGYQNLEYPVAALEQWVSEVNPICNKLNVSIMDLFQWEQENAHWATRTSSEQDIVREEVIPFNNRLLIELFWSLDPKYRYQYYPVIYIKIMKKLWQNALSHPFNPTLRSFLYMIPRILGLERSVYNFYKRRKFISAIKK